MPGGTSRRGGRRPPSGSGAQEGVADDLAQLVGEVLTRPFAAYLPAFDHVEVVRDLDRLGDVLIDEEERHTSRPRRDEFVIYQVGDPRREAGRRLVHEQQRRIVHELLRQRQHLRLAAAQRRRAPPPPLPQAWKRRVGALEDGRDAGAIVPSDPGAELEILLDRQLRKDVLPLGNVADSEPLDRVGREGLDLPPAVEDPATPRMEEAEDRLQQRRLAGAVRADDAGKSTLLKTIFG